MKITALCLMGTFSLLSFAANADERVNGYYRNNGTYVQPHMRSTPDSSYNNNWSVSPNVNPYTGTQGTHVPTYNDRPPATYSNPYGSNPYGSNPYGSHRR